MMSLIIQFNNISSLKQVLNYSQERAVPGNREQSRMENLISTYILLAGPRSMNGVHSQLFTVG